MPITLNEIPGFSDIADSNFAAEQFALGINFARTVDNAKFGIVRPEVFVTRNINGDTIPLPTSPIDGYTYQREELSYCYSFSLTGGTSTGANGTPSLPGAIRYLYALVDQTTGAVSTYVEYLVGDGSAPQVSTDGTLTVFTIATRRLTSLVVAATPVYSPVLDTEAVEDAAVTESLAQRMNRNAKFAALSAEIMYMGEFTDGQTCPQPVSPADGYVYGYDEVTLRAFWRWTTPGAQFADLTDPNHKQLDDIYCSVNAATGLVTVEVDYYHSGLYVTNDGRVIVMAFCKRKLPVGGLGAGVVDFVDLSTDYLSSGKPDRADVTLKMVQNTRYAICRTEFFEGNYTNGQQVPLPVSPIDGYQYSREELTYIFGYSGTGPGSAPRYYQWNCDVDQASGIVTSQIVRVPNGGASDPTSDGHVEVTVVARRDHVSNQSSPYQYDPGGNGASDTTALQNGGFDAWNKNTDVAAQSWVIEQNTSTSTPVGSQQVGLVSGYSQRLSVAATGQKVSVMSSSVSVASDDLRFLSYIAKAYGAGATDSTSNVTIKLILHLYGPVGDTCTCELNDFTPTDLATMCATFVQIPNKGDTTVSTTQGQMLITGTLDFIPVQCRIEILITSTTANDVDLDEVTFISQVNPSIGQVAQRGSDSLAVFPALTWDVTDTEFTPDLTVDIDRADGTTTSVTDGSGTTVTGLTQSTTYQWYPFLNELTGHIESVMTGGVGVPAWLQAAASRALYIEWYALKNLPLAATPIEVVTLATLGGGGSPPPGGGSGGGDNGCLEESMFVREQLRGFIMMRDVRVGDALLSEGGKFIRVMHVEAAPHQDWIVVRWSHGGKLAVTTGHPFTTSEGGLVRACELTVQHLIPWTDGVCSPVSINLVKSMSRKIKATLAAPHTFYAGATKDLMTLTHNFQPVLTF